MEKVSGPFADNGSFVHALDGGADALLRVASEATGGRLPHGRGEHADGGVGEVRARF